MKNQPWFKAWTEARKDRKLQALSVADRWTWFCLLCFAAEQWPRGTIVSTPKLLAVECGDGDPESMLRTCNEMAMLHLVDVKLDETKCNVTVTFPAFEKRQQKSPSSDRKSVTDRVRKHRAAKKLRHNLNGVTSGNEKKRAETSPEVDIEEEKENKKKNPPAPKGEIVFVLPDCIPKPDWDAYIDMRRANRKKLTVVAMRLLANKLTASHARGHDLAAMLQAATVGNWSSVYEPDRPPSNGKHEPKKDEPLEYFQVPPEAKRKPEPKP